MKEATAASGRFRCCCCLMVLLLLLWFLWLDEEDEHYFCCVFQLFLLSLARLSQKSNQIEKLSFVVVVARHFVEKLLLGCLGILTEGKEEKIA